MLCCVDVLLQGFSISSCWLYSGKCLSSSWGLLEPTARTNMCDKGILYLLYVLVVSINWSLLRKVFERSEQTWFKGIYRLFTLSELPDHADIFQIEPNWEQASFMPQLYIKAALGNFPLWKPRTAAPDIYLHFRAYEGLLCSCAS